MPVLFNLLAKTETTQTSKASLLRETNGYFACNKYKYMNLFIYYTKCKGKVARVLN